MCQVNTPYTDIDLTEFLTSRRDSLGPFSFKIIGGTSSYISFYSKESSFHLHHPEVVIVEEESLSYSPFIKWVSPENREAFHLGQNCKVELFAMDLDGEVAGVQLFMNNRLWGEDTTPPYEWEIPLSHAGPMMLEAIVKDDEGNITPAESITITGDNQRHFSADADTFLRGGVYSNSNFGKNKILAIKESHLPQHNYESLLRFKFFRTHYHLYKAFLRLTPVTDLSIEGSLSLISDDSWDEENITKNNTSQTEAAITTTFSSPSGGGLLWK